MIRNYYTSRIKAPLISVIMILFFVRLALPQYIKYFLFPMIALASISALIELLRNNSFRELKLKLEIAIPIMISGLIYIIAVLLTQDRQEELFKEFVNILAVLAFFFIIEVMINSKRDIYDITNIFKITLMILSLIIASVGLIKLYFLLIGVKFRFLQTDNLGYPVGSSLSIDNNFFNLIPLFGIIVMVTFLFKKRNLSQKIFFQITLLILLFSIFLSTSRRGIIIAYIVLFVFLLLWAALLFYRKDFLKYFRQNTIGFVLISIMIISAVVYMIVFIPAIKKNKYLSYSKYDYSESRSFISMMSMAVTSIIKGDIKYKDINTQLWLSDFDPLLPYSGWAQGKFYPISELPGFNSEILPTGSIGAKIDKSVKGVKRNKDYYYYSGILNGNPSGRERYAASLYCYVSPDFSGNMVRINTGKYTTGLTYSYYDLSSKGTWQKLETTFFADSVFSVNMVMMKANSSSFDSLQGYLVFAYPELKKLVFDPRVPFTWAGTRFETIMNIPGSNTEILPYGSAALKIMNTSFRSKGNTLSCISRLFTLKKNQSRNIISIFAYASEDFNGDQIYLTANGKYTGIGRMSYDLKEKGKWQKLTIAISPQNNNVLVSINVRKRKRNAIDLVKGDIMFAYPESYILDLDPGDPITWATSSYSEIIRLPGENNNILPKNSKGYLIDKKSNFTLNRSLMVYVARTDFNIQNVIPGKLYNSSVYCFVSPDFNGEAAVLGVNGTVQGKDRILYDFGRKGSWQKLSLSTTVDSGSVSTYISCELRSNQNPKLLKGYVIFCYPEIGNSSSGRSSDLLPERKSKNRNRRMQYAGFLPFFQQDSTESESEMIDSIPDFSKEMINNVFAGPRLDRWRYAIHIYNNEYNFRQKIIGAGFGYTRKFAATFGNKSEDYDYPHNPMLSVLLYSGILGLLAYIWFLFKAIHYYWIYRKEYWTLGLCFLVAFFFGFFSSNTPFDPAILGVLTILPYIIHYNHVRDDVVHEKTTADA